LKREPGNCNNKNMWITKFSQDQQIRFYVEISVAISGIILNVLQFRFLARKGRQKTTFEIFLQSLVIADTMFCLVSVFSVCLLLTDIAVHNMELLRSVSLTVYYAFSNISYVHVIALTLDRFVIVYYPFKHRTTLSKRHIIRFLLLVWFVYVFLGAVAIYLSVKGVYDSLMRALMQYMLPFGALTTICVYLAIAVKMLQNGRSKQPIRTSQADQTNKRRRTVLVCFLTSILFLCTNGLAYTDAGSTMNIFNIVLNLNTCLNSLIYFGIMRLCSRCKRKPVKIKNNELHF